MPIGPNNIGVVRHDLIQRACFEIDAIIQDPHKSRDSCKGDSDDYYYSFILPGLVSPQEKLELIQLYTLVGWGKVTVQNSSELNRRPGMFLVKLYLKPDSRHLRLD
jgi:hypothetical protein